MNEEKELSQHESLSIIRQMLSQAKNEQKDSGMGWIIWGWVLFITSILTVLNMKFNWSKQTFLFWNTFGLITIICAIWKAIQFYFFKKTERVRTYTGDLFKKLNIGFFISLMFIILSINIGARILDSLTPVSMGFALLINLYAFWILIYGTALNFKPSVIGAYVSWAIGLVALFMNDFEKVMLLHAAAVLCGYIIPGHIANREFNKLRSKDKV